ncbi:ABC transporter ATP-binding protein [Kribbella deserti]|uniref:ABC transporter ATP-binding protein n=1 Tax=Kribbella deserti TaxID=1926257 RepID=A0ABV6QN04_9ACTN
MNDPLFGSGIQAKGRWISHHTHTSEVGFWTTVRNLPRVAAVACALAWAADRRAALVAGFANIGQALAAALSLLAVNEVLTNLVAADPTPERVRAALPALLWALCLAVCGSLCRALATAAGGQLVPKVQRVAEQKLLERVANVELAVLEDGAFQRSLAGGQLGVRAIEQLIPAVLSSLSALAGVAATVGVIGVLHPLLMPLLVLGVVPQAWKAVAMGRRQYTSAVRWLTESRQKDILVELLTDQGSPAEEIRVHGLAGFLLGHYRRLAGVLEKERMRLSRTEAKIGVLADAAAGATRLATYIALGGLLLAGELSVALVGTMMYAMTRVTAQLSSLLTQFNALYRHGLFVADYSRVLESAGAAAISRGGIRDAVWPEVISAHDLVFSYPGAAEPALEGVDLELRRGEVVALVGVNGSGKSTVARLLAGLYQPQHGTIRWDGIPVQELDRETVAAQIGWIGQNFQRWPFTVRANTIVGRPDAEAGEERLAAAADFADATETISGLPDGWNTLLARDFEGGVNLSGGQWQRIALARATFRDARILICDEPTSALDPLSEAETFERLMALAGRDQTVLLITHRMGSIRHADRIYVLDSGQVVENGTYEQLMARGGLFATMYLKQRRQFDLSPPAQETPLRDAVKSLD